MSTMGSHVRSGPRLPKSLTSSDDPNVAEFLTILDKHRQHCEDNGLYIEAEVTKKRIAELRGHEDQRRKDAIHARHIAEKLDIEEGHMVEFEAYNLAWDKKMNEFEEKAALLEREVQEQHAMKLAKWQELQAQKTFKPKYSRDLMQLRQTEKSFAKNMNYMEAQRVKLNADAREKFEFEEAKKDWLSKLFSKQSVVTKQFDNELEMCRQRLTLSREELRRTRQVELDRLLQRYQNMKSAVETQQNIEKQKITDLGLGAGILPAKTANAAVTALFFTPPSTSITPSAPHHLSASLNASSVAHRTLPVPGASSSSSAASNATAGAVAGGSASNGLSSTGGSTTTLPQIDQKHASSSSASFSATQPIGGTAAGGKGASPPQSERKVHTSSSPLRAKQPTHSFATRTKAPTNSSSPLSARKPATHQSGSGSGSGSQTARKSGAAVTPAGGSAKPRVPLSARK